MSGEQIPFVQRLRSELTTVAVSRASRATLGPTSKRLTIIVTALLLFGLAAIPLVAGFGNGAVSEPAADIDPVLPRTTGGPDASGSGFGMDLAPLAESSFSIEPGIGALVAISSSVWIAGPQSLLEIDQATGKTIVEIPMSAEVLDLAATPDSVWASTTAGELIQIDISSGTIVQKSSIGSRIWGLTAADGRVWLDAETSDGTVLVAVDPATGSQAVVATSVPRGVLASANGVLWVWDSSDGPTATELSMSDGSIVGSPVETAAPPVLAGGLVWSIKPSYVDGVDPTVDARDKETGKVKYSISVPRATALAASGGQVWVLSATGSKSKGTYEPDPAQPAFAALIDATTGELVGTRDLDITPARISVGGKKLWISHYESGRLTSLHST